MHNALKFILNDDEGDWDESVSAKNRFKPKQAKVSSSPNAKNESPITANPVPNQRPIARPQAPGPSTSKEVARSRKPEPVQKYSFKPSLNPNSQQILERLNALKQHKETQNSKIEDSLLQRQRQQLLKSKNPIRPSERQISARKTTEDDEQMQSKPKAFASRIQIDNFYSKRFLIRSGVSPPQGEQTGSSRRAGIQRLQLPADHQQIQR